MLRTTGRRLTAAVVVLTVLGAFAAVASAVIPTADGTIHACYQLENGQLRVVDADVPCRPSESPLSWAQQGRPGAPGASGVSRAIVDLGAPPVTVAAVGPALTVVNTVTLPAGSWLVQANVTVENQLTTAGAFVAGGITSPGLPTFATFDHFTVEPVQFPSRTATTSAGTLARAVFLPSGGTVDVRCGKANAADADTLAVARITATGVDSLSESF